AAVPVGLLHVPVVGGGLLELAGRGVGGGLVVRDDGAFLILGDGGEQVDAAASPDTVGLLPHDRRFAGAVAFEQGDSDRMRPQGGGHLLDDHPVLPQYGGEALSAGFVTRLLCVLLPPVVGVDHHHPGAGAGDEPVGGGA